MDRNTTDTFEDTTDLPVDYSRKYIERNTLMRSNRGERSQSDRSSKKEFRERNAKVDLFGDYAETDLDQPTDYSLRYAEDDTDEDEKQNREYFAGSVQEDTIKTYCTEGTPYETPFNFSTATSMSDLREDLKESDILKKIQKKMLSNEHKDNINPKEKSAQVCSEQPIPLTKEVDAEKAVTSTPVCESQNTVVDKSSNYYATETPTSFPRVNSLSSLNSGTVPQNSITEAISKVSISEPRAKKESEKNNHNVPVLNSSQLPLSSENNAGEAKNATRVVDKEGKMVTFCGHDYYAEQTPLMFSRCSSLGSLSGFEQHSIHDDRSSVVSDFSRRTSGIVSPSELPDSPTQTVPPSPRNQKNQSDFVAKIQEEVTRPPLRRLLCAKSHIMKKSVFEDDIATFKEESTPIEFSTATSLSSLTIDDEVKDSSDYATHQNTLQEVMEKSNKIVKSTSDINTNVIDVERDHEQVSDGDEDDEDMLAACISMGMQNNRYKQSFKTASVQKPTHSESSARYARDSNQNRLESRPPVISTDTPSTTLKGSERTVDTVVVPDTVHVYCTEDTPADISPVGSQSNLSALSMPSVQEDVKKSTKSSAAECHRNDLSDESSNLSGDDEKILHECIQSGMPKVRQITPPPTNCIRFGKKSEVLSQKFNICGTPSSSPVESNHGNKTCMHSKSVCSKRTEHESTLSDDNPNHSEDEAILSECIQSAMPKIRFSISPSLRAPLLKNIQTSTTVSRQTPSSFPHRQTYLQQNETLTKKPISFDDNFSLSEEEEDIILAQCIQSGMPKALSVSSTVSVSALTKQEKCLKSTCIPSSYLATKAYSAKTVALNARLSYMASEKDVSQTLVGNTSCSINHFSVKTPGVSSGQCAKHYDTSTLEKINITTTHARNSHLEGASRNAVDSSLMTRSNIPNCRSPMFIVTEDDEEEACIVNKSIRGPSQHSPVSSLSEDGSLGSIEEWALLELCITSRNKYCVQGVKPADNAISHTHEEHDIIPEDNYSVCSYNSYVCKT